MKMRILCVPSGKLLMILLCLGLQTACSLFQEKIQKREAQELAKAPRNAPSNNKIYSPKPLLSEVRKLEGSLAGKREVDQYSKVLPWFESEEEKAEFLRLPDFESKQQWLNEHNFGGRSQKVQSEMESLVESKDIALGMPAALVRKSWGEPENIEVSGNPQFKNERWKYHKFVTSPDGYKSEKKIVYFEGGRVVGWEVE